MGRSDILLPVHPGDNLYVVDVRDVDHQDEYLVLLYGVRLNGAKILCILRGIHPYVDIEIPDNVDIIRYVAGILSVDYGLIRSDVIKHRIVKLLPFIGYNSTSKPYLRCYFRTNRRRLYWMNKLSTSKYKMASNDTVYHRKVLRDFKITPSAWMKPVNVMKSASKYKSLCTIDYVVATGIEPVSESDNGGDVHPPLVILAWDIETHISSSNGGVPLPSDPSSEIFMIGCSIYRLYSTQPIVKCVLSTLPCDTSNDIKIHVVSTERLLILAFIKLLRSYQPDLVVGFNDSDYDWRFVFAKIEKYSLQTHVNALQPITHPYIRYNRDNKIKIDGRLLDITVPNVHGMVPIDVRSYCCKLVKSEESSLKYYLNHFGLDSKEDMTIIQMRDAISQRNTTELLKVATYCFIDAVRAYELFLKLNIFGYINEMANMTYLSTFDVFTYAGGMKVRNFIMSRGTDTYAFDVSRKVSESVPLYPGGYVVSPVIKLHKSDDDLPVACVDVESLYPSIQSAYNISPEMMIFDSTKLDSIDNSKYYPYKIEYSTKVAWILRYHDKSDMGLIPRLLQDLFAMRRRVKSLRSPYARAKEAIDRNDDTYRDIVDEDKSVIEFKFNYYDSKQLAIKILMNTFYGDGGSPASPFYNLMGAVTTTMIGQDVLRTIIDYLQTSHDCTVVYGDTDSAYFTLSKSRYVDCREDYRSNNDRISYWERLIAITLSGIAELVPAINKRLHDYTSSELVNVSSEGCVWPVMFTGKKHYFGKKHENTPNMHALLDDTDIENSLMIKGLEIKKRGTNQYTRRVITDMIRELFSIKDTTSTVTDVVMKRLDELMTEDIDRAELQKTGVYRPDKCNQFTRFIDRLKREHPECYIPKPDERFTYYVKKISCVTLKGLKQSVNICDRMCLELSDTDEIDRQYYNDAIYTVASTFLHCDNNTMPINRIKQNLITKYHDESSIIDRQKHIYSEYYKSKLIYPKIIECKSVLDIQRAVDRYLDGISTPSIPSKLTVSEHRLLVADYVQRNGSDILKCIKSLSVSEIPSPDHIDAMNSVFQLESVQYLKSATIQNKPRKKYHKSIQLTLHDAWTTI